LHHPAIICICVLPSRVGVWQCFPNVAGWMEPNLPSGFVGHMSI
jgi:hypothetical protein